MPRKCGTMVRKNRNLVREVREFHFRLGVGTLPVKTFSHRVILIKG